LKKEKKKKKKKIDNEKENELRRTLCRLSVPIPLAAYQPLVTG
jgi:hypothetical protein